MLAKYCFVVDEMNCFSVIVVRRQAFWAAISQYDGMGEFVIVSLLQDYKNKSLKILNESRLLIRSY